MAPISLAGSTSQRETVLSVVASSPNQRLVLAVRVDQEKPMVLRTESFSPDVGWYTQQVLEMTRQELNGLKSVLGVHVPSPCRAAVAAVSAPPTEGQTRLLSFAEAYERRA